eukprot:CAMPEP_0206136800 /NCGR_PEP_ID=MMETSP1473-20131121/2027_1 /ASSEMBLY_ACC=CAM_ASM_001109 /TAXON_ID=1461547 /ORGANISM="Stichococcus sp, Strain RCC1054" /LENGTH=71 /DNA_ID=CAMNT_0053529583 /DNA_START=421 /DNA_END=634 /DNA_ORIENTATION=+
MTCLQYFIAGHVLALLYLLLTAAHGLVSQRAEVLLGEALHTSDLAVELTSIAMWAAQMGKLTSMFSQQTGK